MRMLFVGENWRGSSARSLRESLENRSDLSLGEVAEDQFLPQYRTLPLRVANRILKHWQRSELEDEIRRKIGVLKPDILLVYKGNGVSPTLIEEMSERDILTVNVFPDCSPHAHGDRLKITIGEYDLVLTTKPFHPEVWESTYGYSNKCLFVPHGYDPSVHYWAEPPNKYDYDVVLAAGWRPEYEELMGALAAELQGDTITVAVAGPRWKECWTGRPVAWEFYDGLFGRAYGEFLRRGQIAIAPVNRCISIRGKRQPGDEDTTRTYELAAANVFFMHQRTDYAQTLYDEETEVPMWSSPSELAELIRYYLPRGEECRRMAQAAHARAVPDYSVDARANEIVRHLKAELYARRS